MATDWDLRRIRYFLAVVVDDGGFTRAAARLHVAQPSLSAQVRRLEEELGVRLLHRSPREVRLTEAGALLADDARALVKDLTAVLADLRAHHPSCVRGAADPEQFHLRRLGEFVDVAEHGSYERAARHRGVSPSGLNAALQRLERHLGLRLVQRGRRLLTLTPAGQALVPEARRLLLHVARSTARAVGVQRGRVGSLRLGYIHGARTSTLPHLARVLARRAPDITLVGSDGWPSQLLHDLVGGTLDLVLTRYPDPHPDLDHETVLHEPLLVALPLHHPLAEQPQVPLAALRQDTLVLWPRAAAPRYFDEILDRCATAGFRPDVREDHLGANADMSLVIDGTAVALTTPSKARVLPAGVVARPLLDQPPLPLDVVWRRGGTTPVLDTVLDVLRREPPPTPDG